MTRTDQTSAAPDVAAAEQEAREAEDLLTALEERVREGDDSVTPEQVASARELGRFAKLRSEAARRKAERARLAARLAAATGIHDEVTAYAETAGPQYAELLQAAHDACTAFVTAVNEREARLGDWRTRMSALNVPEHTGPGAPHPDHGRIAYNEATAQVIAGGRRLQKINAGHWLGVMLSAVAAEQHLPYVTAPVAFDANAPYSALTNVDDAHTPPEGVRWYRHRNGAISYRQVPWTTEELKRLDLAEISREEALG